MQGFLAAAQRCPAYSETINDAMAAGVTPTAAFGEPVEPELNFLVGRNEFKNPSGAQPVGRNLDVQPRILGVDPVAQDIIRRKVGALGG